MPCAGGTGRGSQRGGTVLRDSNRRRLLALLQDHGALTRADLVRRSGISPATVSRVVAARPGGRASPSGLSPSCVGVAAAGGTQRHGGHVVHIDADANLGGLAESMWGAGRGVSEAAFVKVDTGVGAALIIGGQLYRGAVGTAGEMGHSTIAEDGPVCRCGNRGCLERFVGAPALLESLRGSHGDLSVLDMIRLADNGDAGCRRVIGDAGRLIGVQVANLCNLLNPQRVIIGGSLSAAGDILLDPIRASLERCALPMAAATAEVVAGELGDRATVLGALSLVFRQVDPFELKPRRGPVPVARIQPAVKEAVEAGPSSRSGSV